MSIRSYVGSDWMDAVGATASPTGFARVLSKMKGVLPTITNKEQADEWADMASELVSSMQAKSRQNLFTAGQAGFQPSRYIGIDSGAGVCLAGVATAVNVNTNEDARIISFRVDATWAIDFTIQQIAIGNRNHVIGNAAIPATAFLTGVSLPPTSTPIMKAGAGSVVTVFNRGAVARQFNALYAAIPVGDEACNAPCAV